MRTKSESRRQIILDAAFQVFLECGFSAASMSEISARVGGSKATLYSYFSSKEELFVAVIRRFAEEQFADLIGMLDANTDLAQAIERFGVCFITLTSQPELILIHRNVMSEAGHSDIGRLFYAKGPQEMLTEVGAFLQRCMDDGKLRKGNSHVAAQHLIGLLCSEMRDAIMLGVIDTPEPARIEAASHRATEVFLRGYALPGTMIV